MNYLDNNGLKTLVNNINKKTIHYKEYKNISAIGNDILQGSVYFFKLKNISDSKWTIKYRITEAFSDGSSLQHSNIEIGGYGHKVSYTKYNNIVADESNPSAVSNIVALNRTIEDHMIGLNISNTYSDLHNIRIEIEYLNNCDIVFIDTPIQLTSLDNFIITEMDFKTDGISKLQGVLTIGDLVYDGTKNVTVPIYDGT